MKNATIEMTALLAALAAFAANAQGDQATAAAATLPAQAVVYEWQFDGDSNPATPRVSPGLKGDALAAITPGPASDGWVATNAILGDAQGVWDLGQSGSISLSFPSGLGADGSLVTVKVIQYSDGGFYSASAKVAVDGAALVGTKSSVVSPTLIGQWKVEETQWRASANGPITSISVAGVHDGSLIDQVVVQSALVVTPPPILSIRPVGQGSTQVVVSWPTGNGGMVLEQSPDLSNPAAWQPVPQTVQTDGDVSSVTLDVIGDAQFYRLRQP